MSNENRPRTATARAWTIPSGTYPLMLAAGCLAAQVGTWSIPWAREIATDDTRHHIALIALVALIGELGRRLWRVIRAALRARVRRFLLDEHTDAPLATPEHELDVVALTRRRPRIPPAAPGRSRQ